MESQPWGEMKSPRSKSHRENRDSCKLSETSFILWLLTQHVDLAWGLPPQKAGSRTVSCTSLLGPEVLFITVPQSHSPGAEYQPPQAVLSPGLPRGLVLGHTDSRCDPLPPLKASDKEPLNKGPPYTGGSRHAAGDTGPQCHSSGAMTGRNGDAA